MTYVVCLQLPTTHLNMIEEKESYAMHLLLCDVYLSFIFLQPIVGGIVQIPTSRGDIFI